MKFKKVEIQAFRAYNDVKDGTFDFTTESNEVADFISIYAPNGFGKTSFYDAVEWGFTNNIGRLLRRDKDNLSSAKAEESNYILKNKDAIHENKDGFVKLHLTSERKPIERKIPKPRSNQLDFKFRENETDETRKYFQEVILSQEWIDAFLKEDDASIRYEKFIKSFGEVSLDNKHKIITELIKHNDSKIEELKQELKALNEQLKINFNFDPEILSKINFEIEQLNKRGEKISLVRFDWTEKHIQQLTDLISGRITDLRYEISKFQEKITAINSAVTGDNISNINIELYFETKERLKQSDEKLTKLNKIKKQFEELHVTESAKKNKEKELHKITQAQSGFLELLVTYPKYLEINKELTTTNELIGKRNEELKNIDLQLEPILKTYSEIKVKVDSEIENRQKLSSKLTTIPELSKSLDEKNAEKKNLTSLIESSTKTNSEHGERINTIAKEIKDWEEIASQISTDNYQIPENGKTKSFYESIKRLKLSTNSINELKITLSKTENEIANANKLNADIEQLIAKGADVISKSQSSVCPLCKHEYDNFEMLIQKVSENTFLSERMKNLLVLKNKTEKDLETVLKQQKEEKDTILICVNPNINSLKEKQSKETIAKNELSKVIAEYKLKVQNLDKEINELLKELGGNNIETLKEELDKKIIESSKTSEALKTSQEENIKARQPFEQRKNIINEHEISAFKAKMNELKGNASYKRIINFMSENQIEENNIVFEFDKRQKDFQTKIRAIKDEIEKCTKSITEYQKTLEKNEEAVVISDIQQVESEKESFNQKIISFEYFLKSELEIDFINKTKDELGKLLDDTNSLYKEKILKIEGRIQSFEKTKGYKESVLPFLRHEEFKRKEKTILEEKSFLEKTVNPKLEQERRLLSEYIEKQIESFFHGKLINSLYRKIDPHPKYKEISFKCDFSIDNKPRLNVFVAGENDEPPIVPTLYFSTAQLNILSLSIFLAKALNVKDNDGNSVDCIFIDDPIQSMDSINILSTIDLLRSISVNMGKQIVLATHDENFHNLLQKKIPSDRFRAKYIELETFGKVKQ
jgi:exonuclease SbcC